MYILLPPLVLDISGGNLFCEKSPSARIFSCAVHYVGISSLTNWFLGGENFSSSRLTLPRLSERGTYLSLSFSISRRDAATLFPYRGRVCIHSKAPTPRHDKWVHSFAPLHLRPLLRAPWLPFKAFYSTPSPFSLSWYSALKTRIFVETSYCMRVRAFVLFCGIRTLLCCKMVETIVNRNEFTGG